MGFPIDSANELFRRSFGANPAGVGFAPGRVNLIGEHVDYNAGVVLPMALARGTAVALALRDDDRVRAVSESISPPLEVRASDAPRSAGFAGYPLAAWRALGESDVAAGRGVGSRGFDVAIASDLPIGAGLSSSAALLVATLRAFERALGIDLPPRTIADLAYDAETRHIGVACGRMDQIVCALAMPGRALRIDCRDGATREVALPLDRVAILVADSATRRELTHSAYNDRVRECGEALTAMRARRPAIRTLRDVTLDDLEHARADLSAVASRRAFHVVREIARVAEFETALATGDVERAGRVLDASHADLRDEYEVSGPALDALQRALRSQPGCLGARMTGAGFAGCLVALVRRDRDAADPSGPIAQIAAGAVARYRAETGREAAIFEATST